MWCCSPFSYKTEAIISKIYHLLSTAFCDRNSNQLPTMLSTQTKQPIRNGFSRCRNINFVSELGRSVVLKCVFGYRDWDQEKAGNYELRNIKWIHEIARPLSPTPTWRISAPTTFTTSTLPPRTWKRLNKNLAMWNSSALPAHRVESRNLPKCATNN